MSLHEGQSIFPEHLAAVEPLKGRDKTPQEEDHVFLSFGSPDSNLFPVKEWGRATKDILENRLPQALQYRGGEGPAQIKDWIIARSKKRLIKSTTENILITDGAAQGIDFATRSLLEENDEVWVEGPTYFFALQSFQLAGAKVKMMPIDQEGLNTNYLERELQYRSTHGLKLPKVVYCIPNFHNPTGATLPNERRRKLAELVVAFDFYIIEDDAYTEVNFTGDILPAIQSYAPERVLYLGTFSKVIAPGIRLGWVIAPPLFIEKMTLLRLGPQPNPFTQEILGEFLQIWDIEAHVARLAGAYRQKRDVMVRAIERYFHHHASYHLPNGGFFLWITLKAPIIEDELLELAFTNGVSVVASESFYTEEYEPEAVSLRLCFTTVEEAAIERGIQRLAKAYFTILNKEEKGEQD